MSGANIAERLAGLGLMYDELARITREAAGGDVVYCRSCGSTRECDHADALRHGWPTCCGSTMTVDQPDEVAQ